MLLLSKQNQVLREGMDAIEAEMVSLHRTIETKDDAVQKLTRETGRLHREIKRLQVRSRKCGLGDEGVTFQADHPLCVIERVPRMVRGKT